MVTAGAMVTAGYSRPRFQGLVFPITPLAHCTCLTKGKIWLDNNDEVSNGSEVSVFNVISRLWTFMQIDVFANETNVACYTLQWLAEVSSSYLHDKIMNNEVIYFSNIYVT